MTVTIRVTVLATVVAALSTYGAQHAGAQSFYERITSVARTKVETKPRRPSVKPSRPKPVADAAVPLPTKPVAHVAVPLPTKRVAQPKNSEKPAKQDSDAAATTWPRAEIGLAKARCNFLLSHAKAEVVQLEPIRRGPCGDPAPVKLISLGTKPRVVLDPPALVNCDMVKSLSDWLVKDLQPLARKHLKSPIVKIETMSSYSCRNAYGRKNTRLSQHARANAIDIRGFVTAKQARTRLVSHWGPTSRDLKRAARLAVARAKKKREELAAQKGDAAKKTDKLPANGEAAAINTGSTKNPASVTMRPSLTANAASIALRGSSRAPDSGASGLGLAPSRLGGPAISALAAAIEAQETPSWPVYLVSKNVSESQARTPNARFLRSAHRTACKIFGTVLGPEANNTHRDHFHVDLARRRLGSYCR